MPIASFIKKTIDFFLKPFGLVIIRKQKNNVQSKHHTAKKRHSLPGAIQQAQEMGFKPGTVIDVGVASGTVALYDTFPDSKHFLIEPLREFEQKLTELKTKYQDLDYIIACASKKEENITINVHPDLDGSSIYLEDEPFSDVNGIPRQIKAITLNNIVKEKKLPGPYLVKIDVQGAELDVLKGAEKIFNETEYIILEVVLFNFFKGGPRIDEIIAYMKHNGFVVYDIVDPLTRPLDGACSQVDIAFVKENGLFRKHHYYATKEQREKQTAIMKSKL
ncbi:MAG: FkbM family methyltransferase [Spirochaetota bacterium]|nr:FkbM family methyltransferase [Spirochaetota bacterium]